MATCNDEMTYLKHLLIIQTKINFHAYTNFYPTAIPHSHILSKTGCIY